MNKNGPPLRLVFWESTTACNLTCVHCRRLETSTKPPAKDLKTAQVRQLIDQIAEVGRPVLVFSGGEPLLRSDIFDLAGHAQTAGLLTALATNGTLIDARMADRIARQRFDRVSVSLDGADEETHDDFRGLLGAFDAAQSALIRLAQRNVPTQINCTIARHNQHQLGQILELAHAVHAMAVHYFLLVPVGCGEKIAPEQMLNAQEVEERLTEICALQEKTDLQIKATCAPHYYRIVREKGTLANIAHDHDKDTGPLAGMTRGCLAGTSVCFVSHNGQVFPCGYLPVVAGNIRQENFAAIWRNSPVFAGLRDVNRLTGKCGVCSFKEVCGGCRARAYYEFSDYFAEEPSCAYQPPLRPEIA